MGAVRDALERGRVFIEAKQPVQLDDWPSVFGPDG